MENPIVPACSIHIHKNSTRKVLGCGGDYETVRVIECAVCGKVLEYTRRNIEFDDGEAD